MSKVASNIVAGVEIIRQETDNGPAAEPVQFQAIPVRLDLILVRAQKPEPFGDGLATSYSQF
jgi:hypothetical protein